MSSIETATMTWRKSSRSFQGGECVEVASSAPVIAVRDSKLSDQTQYPVLVASRDQWTDFVSAVRDGRFG